MLAIMLGNYPRKLISNYCTKPLHLLRDLQSRSYDSIQTKETQTTCTVKDPSPCVNVKSFFRELRSHDRSSRELSSSKRLDSALCRLGVLVFDVNLADSETATGTGRAWDLGLDDGAVLLALLFDVLFDF